MWAKLWKKRRSIVLTWLMSYLAVFIVPIAISIVIYYEASRALRSEIHSANDTLLRQVQEVMDKEIDTIVRLGVELVWNDRVQQLMYSNQNESDMNYTAYEVANMMRQKKLSSPFAEDFYIYWEAGHSVLVPGSMLDRELAFESIHQDGHARYEDWLELMRRKQFHGFVPMIRTSAGTPHQSLAYISSMPAGRNQDSVGAVVIMVDAEQLVKMLQNIQRFNGAEVFILNGDGQILASNSTSKTKAFPFISQLKGNSEFFYDRYNGVESAVLGIRSAKENLQYVSIMPSNVVWEKVEYVRTFTYVSIAVSLLGAGLLTFIFLRRQYRPIHRLVETLSGEYKHGEYTETNEFYLIQSAVAAALLEKGQVRSRLNQQNRVMRANTLTRLLKGRLDGHVPLDEALSAFGIGFESDDFAVILLCVENGETFLERIPGEDLSAKLQLQQFIITNVVEELASPSYIGYVVELDEGMACLVNFRHSDEKDAETLVRLADEIRQYLSLTYRIELTISISGVQSTHAGIAQACQQAKDAMEYKIVMGKREIISFEKIRREVLQESEADYFYPIQVEQQLINFMKVGDFEKARDVLETIKERNFSDKVHSLPILKCLMFNLMSTMIKTINESGAAEVGFYANKPNRMEAIMRCDTIQEMYRQLTELLQEVCSYMASRLEIQSQQMRSKALQELTQTILEFVEDHYDEVNLNISMIGDRFGMKPAYLSRLFKEQTGEGLLDTINKVRIRKAKELLIREPIGLHDVARQSGFSEVATFIRVFKKFEGITPGKFKEIR